MFAKPRISPTRTSSSLLRGQLLGESRRVRPLQSQRGRPLYRVRTGVVLDHSAAAEATAEATELESVIDLLHWGYDSSTPSRPIQQFTQSAVRGRRKYTVSPLRSMRGTPAPRPALAAVFPESRRPPSTALDEPLADPSPETLWAWLPLEFNAEDSPHDAPSEEYVSRATPVAPAGALSSLLCADSCEASTYAAQQPSLTGPGGPVCSTYGAPEVAAPFETFVNLADMFASPSALADAEVSLIAAGALQPHHQPVSSLSSAAAVSTTTPAEVHPADRSVSEPRRRGWREQAARGLPRPALTRVAGESSVIRGRPAGAATGADSPAPRVLYIRRSRLALSSPSPYAVPVATASCTAALAASAAADAQRGFIRHQHSRDFL